MAIPAENLWSLGELLAKAREDADLDQDELATTLGISRTTVSRWENNKGAPTILEFRAWAHATGARWLFDQVARYLTSVEMPTGQLELALGDHVPRVVLV